MSIVSNIHAIIPFVAKKTAAFSEQRLSVIGYKTDKKTGIKPASVCASIPVLSVRDCSPDQLVKFYPVLTKLIQQTQDSIVRELHESKQTQVRDDQIDIPAVIAFLEEESQGGRLTKDIVSRWFVEVLVEPLTLAVADKLGMPDDLSEADKGKLEGIINSYSASFQAMAGGKTAFSVEKARSLLKVLALLEDAENDSLAPKFSKKLNDMISAQESVLFDL